MHLLDPLTFPILYAAIAGALIILLYKSSKPLFRLWLGVSGPGRVVFVIAALILCVYSGTKPNSGARQSRTSSVLVDTVTEDEITSGYVTPTEVESYTNNYVRPDSAIRNEAWFVHGAYEAWCSTLGYAAFTGGFIRPLPRDTEHQMGQPDGNMLAIQGISEFWSAESAVGSKLFTWDRFFPNADTNAAISIQLELYPSGDYAVRSNSTERLYRRIVPGDWDSDGIPNGLDPNPRHYDGHFFGSTGAIPDGENPAGYYAVNLILPLRNGEIIIRSANAQQVPVDADFIAEAGATNTVMLAYGTDYSVESDEELEWAEPVPADSIWRINAKALNIFAPIPPCTACDCPTCSCKPWECLGEECDCLRQEVLNSAIGNLQLSLPSGVFKRGERRPLALSVCDDCSVTGRISLAIINGASKISLYASTNGAGSVSLPHDVDASTFARFDAYIGYAATSARLNDISFELRLTDDQSGRFATVTQSMTSVEVAALVLEAPEWTQGPRTVEFDPHVPHQFNVTHSPVADPHLPIFYQDACPDNSSVRDFRVLASLRFLPDGYREQAQWALLSYTHPSGSLVSDATGSARLENPKIGGVYRIGATIGGTPRCEGNVVLPLAGASSDGVFSSDIQRVNSFMTTTSIPIARDLQIMWLGAAYLSTPYEANYCGRSDNITSPTVRRYNQVATTRPIMGSWSHGLGSITTICNTPVPISKLTNFLTGYAAQKVDAPQWEQDFGQYFGTSNDQSANMSWQAGSAAASNGMNSTTVSNFVHQIWALTDEKCKRLWPNPATLDNYSTNSDRFGRDYDRFFYSPRFLSDTEGAYRAGYDFHDPFENNPEDTPEPAYEE